MPVKASRQSARRSAERGSPEEPTDEVEASHLVSFLTGYDARYASDHEDGSSDEEYGGGDKGEKDSEEESEDDGDEEEDPDEDSVQGTPSKSSRTGLIGTPSRSARSTPSKQNTPKSAGRTPKRRKKETKVLQEGDPGYIRPTQADAYFSSVLRSSRTSGNSYSSLVRPLTQSQYERFASKSRAAGKSKAAVEALQERFHERYEQLEAELEDGFNLLFYGFGSKRRAINTFVTERLSSLGHCVVVNGHFPGIGIRDVLSQVEDQLGVPQGIPVPPSVSTPLERSAFRIYAYFLPSDAIPSAKRADWQTSKAPLYLVIHNIDAAPLRTPRSLGILSLLASSPNIHLISSFDHAHTPLLFSSTLNNTSPHAFEKGSWTGIAPPSRGFNWVYHNLTTYDDYDLELTYQRLSATSTLGGISSAGSGGISEEGALQILRSVPPMALRLLKLLLTRQLSSLPPDPSSHTAYLSSPTAPIFASDNDVLQRLSREKFIAREEERYNALMGEFKDHGLVVEAQADAEGRTGRWVWVPLGKAAVERVLATMSEVEV